MKSEPITIAYCHCQDCKRWTGSPLPAFAAFDQHALSFDEGLAKRFAVDGVRRWCCRQCGSPLMAQFDYLPDQTYVPLGIFDDLSGLHPEMHCHVESALPWLKIDDALHRENGSARDKLNKATGI